MARDAEHRVVEILQSSSLFDPIFYRREYNVSHVTDEDLLHHYVTIGEKQNYQPSFLFDPKWYKKNYELADDTGCLLLHYFLTGEKLSWLPSMLFDTVWFSQAFEARPAHISPLGFYLSERDRLQLSPNKYFDINHYKGLYPDLATSDIDLYEHFVRWGVFEGRRPSALFDTLYVWSKYLRNDRTKNPFLLFLKVGAELGWASLPNDEDYTIAREVKVTTAPGKLFEQHPLISLGVKRAKPIAFYLPQFHPITENDEWWGTGFTEWRNVPRGIPRFKDHYQPRIPRDLGFYSLDNEETIAKQVRMALSAGLHGFCFYYYNFNGKRLLEEPLDIFANSKTIKFPFCIMWANENWTRRWDGMEHEILIKQSYKNADENALIDDIAKYLKNPNYIRLSGRPILFIYRADVIPNCQDTLASWKRRFKLEHDLDPLIVMSQTFGNNDPRPMGFDAALEFPPHKFASNIPRINNELVILDDLFTGEVRSYDELIKASLADDPSDYVLFKTVLPGWDNDARKQGTGMVLHGSSPSKFQTWVQAIAEKAASNPTFGESLFFVNAWNEWCESAYLEPDVHFGFAYLNALTRGVSQQTESHKRKILLIGHDAFPAGAQQLLLNIGRTLKNGFGYDVSFILFDGGSLHDEYLKVAEVFIVDQTGDGWPALLAHLRRLRAENFMSALTNSTFTGNIVGVLARIGFFTVSLIHELSNIINRMQGGYHLSSIFQNSNQIVFPSEHVRDELIKGFGPALGQVNVQPQGLYKSIEEPQHIERLSLRQSLNISAETKIILNVGYADLRKGIDLFIMAANIAKTRNLDMVFLWVGDSDPIINTWLMSTVKGEGSANTRFVPFSTNIGKFFYEADLFFLTSREDPFPSVILEALSAGLPVAAFEGSGGFLELLRGDPELGFLIPSGDVVGAVELIATKLQDMTLKNAGRIAHRQKMVREQYDFQNYCFYLTNKFQPTPKITVIVPNYNYERYMESRLSSIANQTHPVFEIIVLDDGSSDGSVREIERVAVSLKRDIVLVENEENGGGVFSQWRKGVEMAKGDLIWIAEADDLAEPEFLDQLVAFFQQADIALAFSDSKSIDEHGIIKGESYKPYYNTLFPDALSRSAIFSPHEFLRDYISVKNVILNASSVVWRRNYLVKALENCSTDLANFRMAGDWRLYAEICMLGGHIGYNAHPGNIHRRHSASVTHDLGKQQHVAEIASMHEYIRSRGGVTDRGESQQRYLDEVSTQFGIASPRKGRSWRGGAVKSF